MKRLCFFLLAALLVAPAAAGTAGEKGGKKKLLLITESRGFVHSVVKRGKGGEPALVEKVFQELADKHGFEVTASQDSRKELTGENLKQYDAVWFYTTGELPLSDSQKSDLLAFVRGGKGFGGSHSAADTFYKWREYGELIGAYFKSHPPGFQKIRVTVEDTAHPATKHLGKTFAIEDEIYEYKEYSPKKVHVLMRIDMESVKKNLWRQDADNPLAWSKTYGQGRVFYTALGHREEVWRDPRFQQHVVGGLRYLFGQEAGAPAADEKK